MPETGPGRPHSGPKEISEYEKILTIRDQVFSGSHPRLKVPQHVIRNFTTRSVQSPPMPTTPSGSTETTTTAQQKKSQLPSSARKSPAINEPAVVVKTVTGMSAPPPPGSLVCTATTSSKPASEIDPIFLTKSDDLIRAELKLERQRIERALHDQMEQRRIENRKKPSSQELMPDFDVAEVFAKALEIVKPISHIVTEGANGNIAASDSFDENSFYSSKAPDSPENGPLVASPTSRRQAKSTLVDGADADTDVARRSNGIHYLENTTRRNLATMESRPSPVEVAEQNIPASTDNIPVQTFVTDNQKVREGPELLEEPEYSPPGPNVLHSRRESGAHVSVLERVNGAETYRRPSQPEQDSQRHRHPAQNVKVVRNHITSPAAPQPSRVSPLAVSRIPAVPRQNRRQRRAERRLAAQASVRASPDVPVQPIVPRKRRREQEYQDSMHSMEERRPAESPEAPYIKPEPVSPPPFIEVPPPAYLRSRISQGGSTYIEIDSPRYTPVGDLRESGGRGGQYDERHPRSYETDGHADVHVPRSSSRLTYKRPVREERDLRRVATMQHARQSEYIHDNPEPISDISPRYMRSTSYVVADRPLQEKPRYYDDIAPSYPKPYVTDVRPASPRIREEYIETHPEPRSIGSSVQRRIVIDADGNRYYESVAPSSRMAPPSARLPRAEPYEEGPPIRTAPVRAVSVIENTHAERRYVQDMPPPPVTYRRIPEYARVAPSEHGIYDREIDDRTCASRGASMQVIDYSRRYPTYVEESGYPREELVRMSSVRPPPSRYEDPGEPPIRVQSVRPLRREVSVYIDDEPRQSRGYAPVDRVSYPATRKIREEPYYDDDDTIKMGLEGGQGGAIANSIHDVLRIIAKLPTDMFTDLGWVFLPLRSVKRWSGIDGVGGCGRVGSDLHLGSNLGVGSGRNKHIGCVEHLLTAGDVSTPVLDLDVKMRIYGGRGAPASFSDAVSVS
ncbi:hypothetical protein PRK78_002757 [Emydomyces testavorans]|uniref:Uncharacterized protein n=1 Tax=Emydomyces testavorans TaxID=2070801 RepID=A0AAF0DGZ4_9EURO|nr:hypothetical protein PRK78_002757 [Emydomyces testavorans]